MELLSLGQTILIFVAALFILVFVHELGHFLAAKAFGMRVEKFSIGFPPKILGFTRGETEYSIGATPLGGFVKVSGMLDESMDSEALDSEPQPWEYRSRPVWQRMVVITAGVIFNMILAALIYIGVAYWRDHDSRGVCGRDLCRRRISSV
jgi:regulator of sigma E protease